jgi:glyoxylase-like metal-dependent hydrolase (beta-lactamase superfamily II)
VESRLYFRQLLAGRDFAVDDPGAAQMANFVYLIGDREKRQCLLVDPAWDVDGLLALLDADDMQLVGALATHYHPDHVGGSMFGIHVEGLQRLMEKRPVPVHVQRAESEGMRVVTQLSDGDFQLHNADDVVHVGDIPVRLLHTPGHTPGSQCFLVEKRLVAGDTLFVQGCGRVDLPGGDATEMYHTLTQRLARLDDDVVLFPGHHYGQRPTSTLGEERRSNVYLRVSSLDYWLQLMGGPGW